MRADGPRGAGGPGFFRSRAAKLTLALGFGVCAFVLVAALLPRPPKSSTLATDTANLRHVAGVVIRAGAPLAADGRLDAFGALAADGSGLEEVARICVSTRSGRRPTAAEVGARDHANFPWQRRRGAFDRHARPPVPILWERERVEAPAGGLCRVVAYSDGSVLVLVGDEDAAMLEFFRDNPGQQ